MPCDRICSIRDDQDVSGRIYSVGYEEMTLDGMVDRLASERVSVLVDVRLNPSSRRPGFSKTKLSETLAAAGISYVHEKELGNPQDNRDAYRSGDISARERMRSIVATARGRGARSGRGSRVSQSDSGALRGARAGTVSSRRNHRDGGGTESRDRGAADLLAPMKWCQ